MIMSHRPLYRHRQTGWLLLASALVPLASLVALGSAAPADARSLPAGPVALLVAVGTLVLAFSWLTVVVTDTVVVVRFGIGLYRRTIPVADIRAVAVAPSRWTEGWGVRWTRHGMLYNVGGFETVALELADGRTLRIGTDEPARLAGAIERAIAARARPPR